MFKLLTDGAREKVKREYSMRRLIVALGGGCLILLIGVIALLPSNIISNSRMNESLVRIEALKSSSKTQDAHALVEWLDSLNQKLAVLAQTDNTNSPYEIFLNIINTKPSGILIRTLSWKNDSKQMNIFVSGLAADRQALLDFQNNLNNSGNFSKVSIPISNFAKDKDINFDLNLSLNN